MEAEALVVETVFVEEPVEVQIIWHVLWLLEDVALQPTAEIPVAIKVIRVIYIRCNGSEWYCYFSRPVVD